MKSITANELTAHMPVHLNSTELAAFRKRLKRHPVSLIEEMLQQCREDKTTLRLSQVAGELQCCQYQLAELTISQKKLNGLIGKTRRADGDTMGLLKDSQALGKQLNQVRKNVELLEQEVLAQHVCTLNKDVAKPSATEIALPVSSGPAQFLPCPEAADARTGTVHISKRVNADEWNAYVATHPNATHYHQYDWKAVIERNFQQVTWYFAARNQHGEIVGVASAVHMKNPIVGSFMLSMPFLIYGGPLADTPGISALLAQHISDVAIQSGCSHTELREVHPRDDWHGFKEKVAMVLELADSVSALNERLGSKIRAQVKRAAREQPAMEFGGVELLADFYKVFSRKMRDHGTPVYARSFFEDMLSTFPESTQIAVVRLEGKPVAAAFLIGYRDTLEVPWAASIRDYDRLGMNMYMYHALLEEAVHRRLRYFDFGRSTRNGSTWKFKKQWGAEERQLNWHARSGCTPFNPQAQQPNKKLALAVQVWKRLPLWAANSLGPVIARQLPW